MKVRGRILCLNDYEHGIVIRALNTLRNECLSEKRPTDAIDDLLLKTIDATYQKTKRRGCHEAR